LDFDESGYLHDPETEVGQIMNSGLKRLEDLASLHCLVLLGDAGAGKSTELAELAHRTGETSEAGDVCKLLPFSLFDTDANFHLRTFGADWFQRWKAGSSHLHLFLDGLEEGLMAVDSLARNLEYDLRELDQGQRARLFLRITSRSATWGNTGSLEHILCFLWPPKEVGIFELKPLRRRDVRSTAEEVGRQEGFNADAFIRDVEQAGTVPFARHPASLFFLLDIYGQRGRLPSSLQELFREGCLSLCREPRGRRKPAGGWRLSPPKRMALAQRIAAITLLANRRAIWLDEDSGAGSEADMPLSQLAGGEEWTDNGERFPVAVEGVREVVLNTALFANKLDPTGSERTWSHRSYAEFLAASFLSERELPAAQVLGLMTTSLGEVTRVVPQLHGLAGWAAVMMPEVAASLADTQPEILMLGDPAGLSQEVRARVVDNLLISFEQGRLHDHHCWLRDKYGRLRHDGLVEQLKPILYDEDKNIVVRRAAVQIAASCGLDELVSDLLSLARSSATPVQVRVAATVAVGEFRDNRIQRELMPLLACEADEDPEEDLKGAALLVLWPGLINAVKLFDVLGTPRVESYYGHFRMFLHYLAEKGIEEHLAPEDFSLALTWLESRRWRPGGDYTLGKLATSILSLAWQHLELEPVCRAYAGVILSLSRHHDLYERPEMDLEVEKDRRRLLVAELVEQVSMAKEQAGHDIYEIARFIRPEDIGWLVERLGKATISDMQEVYSELLLMHLRWEAPDMVEKVLQTAEDVPVLHQLLEPLRQVELGSLIAERLRRTAHQQEHVQQQPKRADPFETARQRMTEMLALDREVTDETWAKLAWVLQVEPDGRSHTLVYPSDLFQRLLWQESSDNQRSRLIQAAQQYLLVRDPRAMQWLDSGQIPGEAMLGIWAFFLLAQEARELLENLADSVWEKWAPVFLVVPHLEQDPLGMRLLKAGFRRAPEAVARGVVACVKHQSEQYPTLFVLRRIAPLLSDQAIRESLEPLLLEIAGDGHRKAWAIEEILGVLLREGSEAARLRARQWIQDKENTEQVVGAASALLHYHMPAAWDEVWPLLQDDPKLGRKVVEQAVSRIHEEGRPEAGLDEALIADLYLWLARQYPHRKGPRPSGMQPVTPRMEVAEWRDSLLDVLKIRATVAAVEAMERIKEELPEQQWLSLTFQEVQERALASSWQCLEPQQILMLGRPGFVFPVRTTKDLTGLAVWVLQEIQTELQHDHPPAAGELWNARRKGRKKVWSPKDEHDISTWLERRLRKRLLPYQVTVTREEQALPPEGDRRGQDNDLIIKKVVHDIGKGADEIACVVEVKGCFHAEVKRAMKSQLVNRYLARGPFSAGIYLALWFDLESWDDPDDAERRNRAARLGGINVFRKYLEDQTNRLQTPGHRITSFVLDATLG